MVETLSLGRFGGVGWSFRVGYQDFGESIRGSSYCWRWGCEGCTCAGRGGRGSGRYSLRAGHSRQCGMSVLPAEISVKMIVDQAVVASGHV
jgi:hypothetical protein